MERGDFLRYHDYVFIAVGSLTGTLNQLVSLVPTAVSLTTSAGRLMDILDMPKEDFSDADQVEQFAAQNRSDGIGIVFPG